MNPTLALSTWEEVKKKKQKHHHQQNKTHAY